MSFHSQMKKFFQPDRWTADLSILRPLARLKMFFRRLGVAVGEEFWGGLLSLQAMGLVYTTLLSLVPFLAVMFSVLKAFDAHQEIEPFLARVLAPLGAKGGEVTRLVIEFVNNLRVGVLGALGVVGLFFTVFSLLGQIEDALNYIWRVRRSRSLTRKFSDYFSMVLVGPVLVFSAFALTASAQSHWLTQRILQIGPLGFFFTVVTRVMPFVFLCTAFTFLYKLIPYTQVRFRSAFVGGVTAGLLWQAAGAGFTAFVANSARYTAIYSSFAILVIFLIWLYVGWIIVLLGGKVAYLHQHPYAYLTSGSWKRRGHLFRAWLALSALAEITRRYLQEEPPWRLAQLSASLNVSSANLEELVDEFVRCGLLFRTAEPEGVALGRPPEQVAVSEVLDLIDDLDSVSAEAPTEGADPISHILYRRDQAIRSALAGVTLRSLVSEASVLGPDPENLLSVAPPPVHEPPSDSGGTAPAPPPAHVR